MAGASVTEASVAVASVAGFSVAGASEVGDSVAEALVVPENKTGYKGTETGGNLK